MPYRAPRPCRAHGCPELVTDRGGLCARHARERQAAQDAARPNAGARGYGAEWRQRRAAVLARDPICRACNVNPSTDVDHIVARAAGGTDELGNLQGLCHRCHSRKTAVADGRWQPRGGGGGRISGRKPN
jgi:5-methylcytosine-specific restriction protein A